MTPCSRLARAIGPRDAINIGALAKRAGVPPRQLSQLLAGKPIAAIGFLRLCVVVAHDPLPAVRHTLVDIQPADFDFKPLAIACNIHRGLNKHSVREAGKTMGLSGFTVSRIEHGHVTSIGVVLKVCRYVGMHPFHYLNVSRENHPAAQAEAA